MADINDLILAVDNADEEDANVSLSSVADKNPEQSAKVYNLSRQENIPFGLAEAKYDQISKPDNLPKGLTKFLANRENAAVAKDDLENLSWWETGLNEAKNFGKTSKAAILSGDASAAAFFSSFFELGSQVTTAPFRDSMTEEEIYRDDFFGAVGSYLKDYASSRSQAAQEVFPKPEETRINPAVLSGVQSFVMQAPAMVASVASRNPNIMLTAMGTQTYGDSYLRAREAGLDPYSSSLLGISNASVELLTEQIPAVRLINDLGGGTSFPKLLLNQLTAEIPGEQLATAWQDLNDWMVLNQDQPFSAYLEERPSAAADTLISTIVATTLQGSLSSGFDRLTREKEVIQEISEKASESKVFGRTPDLFQSHLRDVMDEYGDVDLYMDAKAVNELDLQEGPGLDLIQEQLAEAVQLGGDIVIPMDQAVTLLASDNYETLKPFLRLSPQSQNPNPEAVIREAEKNVEMKTRADEIYREVEQQLIDTGRMNKTSAKASAIIIPAFVTTTAQNTGLSVDEVYDMMGVKIVGPNAAIPEGQQILDQSTYHVSPHRFDKFSMDAIGTGEGNQSYSHGLYFASSEDVRDFYKEQFGEGSNTYQADIPEDSELLDYDKPLSEQPAMMEKLGITKESGLATELTSKMSGQEVYDRLARGLTNRGVTSKEEASKYLNSLGIPGLKYLDQDSRGKGKGSSNYVIWDENVVTIEAVNDELRQAESAGKTFNQSDGQANTEKAIKKYGDLIAERRRLSGSDSYIPVELQNIDIDFLTAEEKKDFHDLKQSLPSFGFDSEAAKARNVAKAASRKAKKIIDEELVRHNLPSGVFDGIYLVGSRANGTQKPGISDIDLLVKTNPTSSEGGANDAGVVSFEESLEKRLSKIRGVDWFVSPVFDNDNIGQRFYQSTAHNQDQNLYVAHNLSESGLAHADELGGLAAPSLAIKNVDTGDFDGFGEITLLADPKIIESRKARTFNADVYTPRHPKATYTLDKKKFDALDDRIHKVSKKTGLGGLDGSEIADRGPQELLYNDALKYEYLESIGESPRIPKATISPILKKYAKLDFLSWDLVEDDGFKADAKKYYEKDLEKYADRKVVQDKVRESIFNGDEVSRRYLDGLLSEIKAYKKSNGVNTTKLRESVEKKFRTKKITNGYQDYVTEIFNDIKSGQRIFKGFTPSGNRRYVEYNLENIVKDMTQKLQGGESFNYGAGSVRAAFAQEMKSVASVKKNRARIVSKEEFDKIRDESNDKLMSTLDKLKSSYKYEANSFGYYDDASSAIAEGPRGWNDAFDLDQEGRKLITDLVDYLKNIPTEYFETKIQRAVDLFEFSSALVPKEANPKTIEILERNGLKVIKYDSNKPGARSDAIKKSTPSLLFQDQNDPRGSITFLPDAAIIRLTETSDPSTFLHETGHLFLEMEKKLYTHPKATDQMKADSETLLNWLGVESFGDIKTEQHEKFARGFEKYLGEGKAPSVELKAVFRRFAQWIKQVYRDLRRLDVELNDDVRAVMDRMLATEDEINRVKSNFDHLFESADDAGMTEAEYKTYTRESSPANGKEVLQAKMIKQLKRQYSKWWKDESVVVAKKVKKEVLEQPLYSALNSMRQGGTNKEAKALASEIDELESELSTLTRKNITVKQHIARAGGISREAAVESGIDPETFKTRFVSQGKPLFPAKGGMSFDSMAELLSQEGFDLDANSAITLLESVLESDRFLDADVNAQADNLSSEIEMKSSKLSEFGANRLNRSDVEAHFFGDVPGRFIGLTSKNGMSPDDVAAIHGLASGDELINLINTEPTLNQKVKAETELEMMRRHGDILNDGTIEEEAEIAIRNPERAKKLLAELSALARKNNKPTVDREAVKAYAKETIGKMAYSKIKPSVYRSAEVRSAREAAVAKNKGDFSAAQKAKTQEIINFYLAREAQQAKDKAEANRKFLQSVRVRKYNTKDVHPDYITQMQVIANLYDFRKNPQNQDRARSQLQAVASWIQAQAENEDNAFFPSVIDPTLSIVDKASKDGTLASLAVPSYKQMTVDDIQGVADQVKNLRFVGGQLSENSKAAFKKEAAEVGQSIRDNAKGEVAIPEEPSKRDKFLSGLRIFGEDHVRLANQVEQMDGYQKFGPLFASVYQKIIDASNKELELKRGSMTDLKDAFSEHKNAELKEGVGERTVNLASGKTWTLSRRGRIMLGLYWGSPEGREAIRIGHDVTDNDVQKMLNHLEEKDINLIEKVWSANEKYWPDVSRVNQKIKGVTLPKVEHVPYSINGRDLPGGYMRLFYQYDQKDSLREVKAEDYLMTRTGNRLAKQTKAGSRNERVGSGGRKMSWDLNNIFQALDETVHDVAFAETAGEVSRFIRNPDVGGAIIASYGKEKYESMLSAISGVIAGGTSNSHPINSFMRRFRVAQTYAFLGYSIRNTVQQPLALTNMFGKLGVSKVSKGLLEFYSSPKEMMKFVQDRSEFMINRTAIVNRDTSEIMGQFSGNVVTGGVWDKIKHHAFTLQTIGDASVAYPGWVAAYREGLNLYGDEKKATTYADEFVSATIGSGLIKDMSPMLQGGGKVSQVVGPEMLKGITFMGSYFNVVANLSRDAYRSNDLKTVGGFAEFSRQMAWYLAIPAILSAFLVGDLPEEDDDEGWLAWAVKNSATYTMAQIFILRDIASLINGYGSSSSYTRALDSASRVAKDSAKIAEGEKELDLETIAKLLRASGQVVTIPGSGQVARTLEYLGSDEENEPLEALYRSTVTGIER